MLYCTGAVLRAGEDVEAALRLGIDHEPTSYEWRECAFRILDGVQTIVLQGASVSRYFWPVRKRRLHRARAELLRSAFQIGDESPLKDRRLRNALEHFDERLDEFCRDLMGGVILPTYVGPMVEEPEVQHGLFRAYYTDVGVFEILGERIEVQPLFDELQDLHQELERCGQNGGRLPRENLGEPKP